MSNTTKFSAIPGVGKPCERALNAAGYNALADVAGVDYARLAALHGVGARGLERIHAALIAGGLPGLSGEVPAPRPLGHTVTRGHTGQVAKDIKTHVTDVDPVEYVSSLPWERRVRHGHQLLEIFRRATGEEPVMWGPSMIGYGQTHYESTSGRHGDWFLVGFSPRQAKISFYGMKDFPELLVRLGKYTEGKGCLYVNKLEDIDLGVLEEIIVAQWNRELD